MKKTILGLSLILFLSSLLTASTQQESPLSIFFAQNIHIVLHGGYHQAFDSDIGGNAAYGLEVAKRFGDHLSFTFGLDYSAKSYTSDEKIDTEDEISNISYKHKIQHYPFCFTLGYHWHIVKSKIYPYGRLGFGYNYIHVDYNPEVGSDQISPDEAGYYDGWGFRGTLGCNIKFVSPIQFVLEANYTSADASRKESNYFRNIDLSGLFLWGGINIQLN